MLKKKVFVLRNNHTKLKKYNARKDTSKLSSINNSQYQYCKKINWCYCRFTNICLCFLVAMAYVYHSLINKGMLIDCFIVISSSSLHDWPTLFLFSALNFNDFIYSKYTSFCTLFKCSTIRLGKFSSHWAWHGWVSCDLFDIDFCETLYFG